MTAVAKQDVVLSGGLGKSSNSARAGLLPISLDRAPLGAFDGIAVYLRAKDAKDDNKENFTLYCSDRVKFTEAHRERLRNHGVNFVYIPMADQERFRKQTEEQLLHTVNDPTLSISMKSELVYETSVELVNELLSEPQMLAKNPRIEKVSRAVTMLTLNDPSAFSHLFAASHHDFYTATHMVNVATWMVPLAYALGYRNTDELNHICQAGILHDVGKVYIPSEILNKKGKLSQQEWELIRRHPEMGCKHLEKFEGIHPLVYTVTRQHHERLDGSGYPDGLKADQIDPISRICAVVDSFDAMTAFRPFKERTLSVAQALSIILEETPAKYDQKVVDAWLGLLQAAEKDRTLGESLANARPGAVIRRQYPRFPINCPTRVHILEQCASGFNERPGIQCIAHNISQSGLGFLTQSPVQPNENVRVYLRGKGSLDRTEEGITVRCRAYKDGWYEVGMKFTKLAEAADLSSLGATPAEGAAAPKQ
jgi:HD-GYP domain-containing protein (c-di-GMP phosphodiesterase class II)